MKRIIPHLALLSFSAAALSAVAAATRNLPDTSKMNILFIDIEDTNPTSIGCYGNPIPRTPNLDRFASTAVRFDSAYCQAICCNPSRTSFLTGLRPLSTQVLSNPHVMNDHLPAGVLTLPEMLKNKGLYTAVIGKLFHQLNYAERQLATFDRIEMYEKPAGWKGPEPILNFPPPPRNARADNAPSKKNAKAFQQWRRQQSDRYGDSGKTREQEGDYRMAQTAVALLKEFAQTKKQFCMFVSQSRPHTPLIAPREYIGRYDPNKIPDPPAPVESLRGFPYMQRATGGNPDIFTQKQPTKQQAREAIAAYYACVNFVDDNVGMMLDTLDKEGLDKNTIVIFLGDHGFHLGDHGCWSKYSMLEATRRVALIVRVPGAPANGKVCREFVEFVDLVPTLADLLKFDAKNNLEGTSFAPLLASPDQPWKKAVFMVDGDGGQVVRSRHCSFLELKKGPVLSALYDLEKDPWETINVADDPAYSQARREMTDLLRTGWQAALPAAK